MNALGPGGLGDGGDCGASDMQLWKSPEEPEEVFCFFGGEASGGGSGGGVDDRGVGGVAER